MSEPCQIGPVSGAKVLRKKSSQAGYIFKVFIEGLPLRGRPPFKRMCIVIAAHFSIERLL